MTRKTRPLLNKKYITGTEFTGREGTNAFFIRSREHHEPRLVSPLELEIFPILSLVLSLQMLHYCIPYGSLYTVHPKNGHSRQ